MKKTLKAIRDKLPSKAQVAGAVQGVIGDKLPKRFATEMAFYADEKTLDLAAPLGAKHAVVFIHGSSDTEHGWQPKAPGQNFGAQLATDFSVAPLYLRYNSGLAVSENGEKLSALLEDFAAAQKPLRRLTLIAHSMGGLIAHSAIYHARAQQRAWLKKLTQVFLLGTPHTGAPLAQIAEKGEQILQFIPNPVTLIAASVIGLRSRGLKDLSKGQIGLPAEGSVLQQGVKYVFIAGGMQKKPTGLLNRLMGDGMVRSQSAVQGQKPDARWYNRLFALVKKSPDIRVENLPGTNHLALRTSAEVYRVIRSHFSA
ncbi:MAG: alpha/beta fold hydrolase [Spirochaetes bacterium]|nr:alpha/beta fold hydrolase [Spirochaetota bacterium]